MLVLDSQKAVFENSCHIRLYLTSCYILQMTRRNDFARIVHFHAILT